ncbi:MAG: putative glycosidase [Acidimicrobiales bacterium]|nr:putative glycosidase [Acidimicrobiales bacterium]
MTGPGWWNERRYGLIVHANIATVPSFSAIGQRADWYWAHLDGNPPLAEVLAYHRDRWAHVADYDEFIPFLTFHRFDADELVDLAVAAGMRSLIQVAKHRDGFCWWDAPGTLRRSTDVGPTRNLVAEVSSACRRHGVLFGAAYSMLDWSRSRDGDPAAIPSDVEDQVLDLVERYGAQMLWTDEPGGDAAAMIERARDLADAQDIELAVNDGWGIPDPSSRTFDRLPPDVVTGPWELHRALGRSPGFNRAERAEHLLSTGELLDLLTEVIAKGGSLNIDVGLGVDGTVSELQQQPLRAVGRWVEDHLDVVHGSTPFDLWGDAQIRYVTVRGEMIRGDMVRGDPSTTQLVAIDLAAGSDVVLAGLTPDRYEVHGVAADDGAAVHWEQHRAGVTISRIDRSPTGLAGVYRLSLRPAAETIRLFDDPRPEPLPLQPLLDAAVAGDIVQLHDGSYAGSLHVPGGVTVRGMGWDRTTIHVAGASHLDARASLENVQIIETDRIECRGDAAAVTGCRIDGVIVATADDVAVRSVIAGSVTVRGERATIERCTLRGVVPDAIGILVDGGSGHRITRNEIVEHRCAIRCEDVSASTVTENRIEAQLWAVHLLRCDHVEVADNQVQHTMRAVDVEGGNGSVITGNWVADGDSGAVVEFGATDTAVIDNHVERCRIGVLVWDAPSTRVGPNTFVDIHEEEPCVHGPDVDVS